VNVAAESTVNPNMKQAIPAASFSFLLMPTSRWGFLEEINYVDQTSQSGNLQIKYHTLEWNQWVHWHFGSDSVYRPYLAAGFGISQDEVTTVLAGASRKDQSRFYHNVALGAGLSAEWSARWAAVLEARVWKYELKKDPTASGLLLLKYRL
jgi:hypothetical protein